MFGGRRDHLIGESLHLIQQHPLVFVPMALAFELFENFHQ
jgi:hypothetical protein